MVWWRITTLSHKEPTTKNACLIYSYLLVGVFKLRKQFQEIFLDLFIFYLVTVQ